MQLRSQKMSREIAKRSLEINSIVLRPDDPFQWAYEILRVMAEAMR